MGTVATPTSFTLRYIGESITTAELLSVRQGIYLQTRIPDLAPNIPARVDIGVIGNSGLHDFYIKFYNTGSGGYWNILGLPPIDTDQTFSSNDLFSVYLDAMACNVFQNGTLVYKYLRPDVDESYRYHAVMMSSSAVFALLFSSVLFYPTGSPGEPGATFTTLISSLTQDHVLTPTAYRFTTTGETVTTVESLNGETEGVYSQFIAPYMTDFSGDSISLGIRASPSNTYYLIAFSTSMAYSCSATGFTVTGTAPTGTYTDTDVFSVYMDGYTVYFQKNGTTIGSTSIVVGSTYVFHGIGNQVSSGPYDVLNIRFYPTGKRGTPGATTSIIFDGGTPSTSFSIEPVFDCGGVA